MPKCLLCYTHNSNTITVGHMGCLAIESLHHITNVGSDNADGDDDIDGTSTTRSNGSSRGADDEGQSYPRRYQRSHKHHRDGTRVVVGTVGETFEPPNATDRGSRPDADFE
jgi:hypothetical protein